MTYDLTAAALAVRSGEQRAEGLLEASLARACDPVNRRTFIRRFDDEARAAARAADRAPSLALAGLAVSIKDLFDVQGQPTTAGSRVLAGAAPAAADAPAVARLRAAGAALVGHTNMSEFAFSGVGINPHHGVPVNAATAPLDATPRVPGGSTSGGATSVATGAAWAALGSDTGGSIRIPAALQGLVGFKCSARLVPTEGCIPLSFTLDTACAITRSVRDAVLMHELLAARTVRHEARPLHELRLALPTTLMLDGLDAGVARAFERALERLRQAGARIDQIALPPLDELARINAQGGFSAAESWAWHRARLAQHEAQYDPRVARRIKRGAEMGAADYIDLLQARRGWIARMNAALQGYDAMLSPTVPVVAPALQPLLDDDETFFAANALLLRNPTAINFLDGCALSLPCQAPGELPVGLMVWSGALADDRVLETSLAIEAALRPTVEGR
jgi:aspartyl-tRNA(Asn)/glutamyl-tRNA(Gln) amidotransferase subunit A